MIVVSRTTSEKIKSNVSSAVSTTTTNTLIDTLQKYLRDVLREAGIKMDGKNSKKNSDGSITYKLTFLYTPEGAEDEIEVDFYVNGKPTNDSNEYVDLSFMYPDFKSDKSGQRIKKEIDKYKNVPNTNSDIMKKCQQVIDTVFGVDTFEDIPENLTSSSHVGNKLLKFTVQKEKSDVTASSYKIHVKNIFASYDPSEALEDINTIVSDTEFLDELDYGDPCSYGAAISDEDLDIICLDNLDDESYTDDYKQIAYNSILDEAYKFYLDCKFIEYTSCGRDMDRIQQYSSNYQWRLVDIIDTISKRVVADKLQLVHPMERIHNLVCLDFDYTQYNFWKEFVTCMSEHITHLINVLTLYASNSSKEDESMIHDWIRTWKYDLDYILLRSSM